MTSQEKILLLGQTNTRSGHAQDVYMLSRVLTLLGRPHEYLNLSRLARHGNSGIWRAVVLIGNITQMAEFEARARSMLGDLPMAAYAHWELPTLPRNIALPSGALTLFAPTRFTCQAYEGGGYQVSHLPPILQGLAHGKPIASRTTTTFQVMCVANLHSWPQRKNVVGSIRAFQSAFPEESDVRLFLKCSKMEANPDYAAQITALADGDKRILVCDDNLDAEVLRAKYHESHVYLSLHRSEGFGYTIAEAMWAHLPVVATPWSGSLDLMGASAFGAVDYALVPLTKDEYPGWEGQHWADPSIEHAATLLRSLYKMSDDNRSHLAQQALRRLRRNFHIDGLAWHYERAFCDLVHR